MEQINWINYQYQLLRYQHDHVTGEFANIGMVYFDAKTSSLFWRFEDKGYSRLSHFFGYKVQGSFILSVLKELNKELQMVEREGLQRFQSIEVLTNFILSPDDNGWYFSQVWKGRHFEQSLNFEELYARIIGRYQEESIKRQDDALNMLPTT